MRFLRTNTAVIVTVGPFYDKTDGVTIEGSLTITNERITLTADTDDGSAPTLVLDNVTGATSGTSNDLNYITNTDAGLMQLELSASNTNRLGRMFLTITDAANHVPVFHEFMVVNTALYDAFFASSGGAIPNAVAGASGGVFIAGSNAATTANITGNLTGNVTGSVGSVATGGIAAASFAAGAINAAAIADGAIDAATFAAGAINAAAIASDAITDAKVASDVTIASVTGAVGSVTGNVGGNVAGSVGSVTGLTAADVGAIKAKTDNLPSDPADQSLIIAATNALAVLIGTPAGASLSADVATVDTVVDAIKAKTDSLNFGVSGKVDANITHVNEAEVTGDGQPGTEWGPA